MPLTNDAAQHIGSAQLLHVARPLLEMLIRKVMPSKPGIPGHSAASSCSSNGDVYRHLIPFRY